MTTKEVYCANDYCDNEATYIVYHSKSNTTPLCETCKTAYEWGQASPGADLIPIEDFDDEGVNNDESE